MVDSKKILNYLEIKKLSPESPYIEELVFLFYLKPLCPLHSDF